MAESELLALLYDADDPMHRPRRTLVGALVAILIPVGFVAALAEPFMVVTVAVLAVVDIVSVRWAAGRRLQRGPVHRLPRGVDRRFCLLGTTICFRR